MRFLIAHNPITLDKVITLNDAINYNFFPLMLPLREEIGLLKSEKISRRSKSNPSAMLPKKLLKSFASSDSSKIPFPSSTK